jgi:phage terminase large subunit
MIRLSEQIAPHFHKTFHSKITHQIDIGGRGSTKTSKNALKIAYSMVYEQNCNCIAIRRNKTTLRDSAYAEIKLALTRLGLIENVDYICTVSPLQIKILKNDNSCFFGGLDSYEKLKGMIGNVSRKDNQQLQMKYVWLIEITEFRSVDDITQVVATFSRGIKDYFCVLYEFNPPKNKFHFINRWLEVMEKDNDCVITKTDYRTVPAEWLGTKFIKIAEQLKSNDPERYNHIYLGHVTGIEGNIYNFDLIKTIDDFEYLPNERPVQLDFSTDTGHMTSATTCSAFLWTSLGRLIVLDTYYYSPNNKTVKKTPSEFSNDIAAFVKSICGKYQLNYCKIVIDSAEGGIRNQFFKDYNVRLVPVHKTTNELMIDNVSELIARGCIYVVNNPNNQIFLLEHKNYEYKEGSAEKGKPEANKNEKKVLDYLDNAYYNTHSKSYTSTFADHTCDVLKYIVTNNLQLYELKY